MIRLYNSLTRQMKNKSTNGGFSLIELLVVVAIMAVLVGVIAPTYISYMHKARVAADWANLRSYYTVIQADYISTGEYNPDILTTDMDRPDNWRLTEITYPDGTKVKMKEGYFAIAKDGNESGYQISYYCNKCLTDWDKYGNTCTIVIGDTN